MLDRLDQRVRVERRQDQLAGTERQVGQHEQPAGVGDRPACTQQSSPVRLAGSTSVTMWLRLASRLRCVRIAPLGRPVVPRRRSETSASDRHDQQRRAGLAADQMLVRDAGSIADDERAPAELGSQRLGLVGEPGVVDQRPGATVRRDRLPVVRMQPVVQRHPAEPSRADRQIGLQVADLVGLQVEHSVAGLQAEAAQASGEPGDPVAELGERAGRVRSFDRDPGRVPPRRPRRPTD
jgi:hypothetical protein